MNSSSRDWVYELMYVLQYPEFSGGMLSDLENCDKRVVVDHSKPLETV